MNVVHITLNPALCSNLFICFAALSTLVFVVRSTSAVAIRLETFCDLFKLMMTTADHELKLLYSAFETDDFILQSFPTEHTLYLIRYSILQYHSDTHIFHHGSYMVHLRSKQAHFRASRKHPERFHPVPRYNNAWLSPMKVLLLLHSKSFYINTFAIGHNKQPVT